MDAKGSVTFGAVRGPGWVFQATFSVGVPNKGNDKRDKVKFDSVAYFFLCS